MRKSLFQIILANLFYLVVVAGTNFLLPAYTSYSTYAAIKEYTLYMTTYSDLITCGYIQGMYLKYGGKEVGMLDPSDLGSNFFSYLAFQAPIAIIITAVGIILKDPLITSLGISFIISNVLEYYQMLYQATGEYKAYGYALNCSRVMVLLAYVLLIFAFKTDNYIFYIFATPLVTIPLLVIVAIYLNRKTPFLHHISVSGKEIGFNIRLGVILMLGTFVASFFSSISKWFVNYLMDDVQFALFSFAVSMENLVTTFMTPVTVSMYNVFCKKPSLKEVRKIKDATLIYAFVIVAGAFPSTLILKWFIPKYLPSVKVMIPLFAAQALATIIKGIYVNKYKAEGKQKKYLIQMIAMVALAFVANIIAYLVFGTLLAFAVATLVVMVLWLLICEIDDKEWHYSWQAYVSLAIMLTTYLVTGNMSNTYIGCAIYVVVGIATALIFMRPTVMYLLGSLIKRKRHTGDTATVEGTMTENACDDAHTDEMIAATDETRPTGDEANGVHGNGKSSSP